MGSAREIAASAASTKAIRQAVPEEGKQQPGVADFSEDQLFRQCESQFSQINQSEVNSVASGISQKI